MNEVQRGWDENKVEREKVTCQQPFVSCDEVSSVHPVSLHINNNFQKWKGCEIMKALRSLITARIACTLDCKDSMCKI